MMGKKKKTTEKLLSFYRGPKRKSAKIANEGEMKIIEEALKDCLQIDKRQCCYKFNWTTKSNSGQETHFKIVPGLSAGLRCLKQKRTLALLYDHKAHSQLIKYLNEFAYKLNIPIIQVQGLSEFSVKFNFQSLSLVSFVKDVSGNEELYQKPGHVKPKQTNQENLPNSLNILCKLIIESHNLSSIDKIENKFKMPNVERIPSTGKI